MSRVIFFIGIPVKFLQVHRYKNNIFNNRNLRKILAAMHRLKILFQLDHDLVLVTADVHG